jgi:hypothetical protein
MNLPDMLRKWGVNVVEFPGWQTRGWLSGYGGAWNPRGVVCHHTANGGYRGIDAPSLNVCVNGRPDLAGPLCQIVLGYSGTAYVIAALGANHAGKGGWANLSGNASVWGIEAENTGLGEAWPAVQVDAFHRCCAALGELSGFGPEMVCGHKEWTPTKIDPAGLDMNQFRSAVAALLDNGPNQEDEMNAEQEAILRDIQGWVKGNIAQAVGAGNGKVPLYAIAADTNVWVKVKPTTGTVDTAAVAAALVESLGDSLAAEVADELGKRLAGE